jgi:uncharacterized membrane protein YhhN
VPGAARAARWTRPSSRARWTRPSSRARWTRPSSRARWTHASSRARWTLYAFALLAAAELAATACGAHPVQWATKPLLAPLLAAHLWLTTRDEWAPEAAEDGGRAGRRAVLAGLGWATLGDIVLLLPGLAAFLAGTACFLGMQLCYIAGFTRLRAGARPRLRPGVLACYLAVWAAANLALLRPLGPLDLAVAPYSLALVTMAATASGFGAVGALGGALFTASDALIGLGAAGLGFPGHAVLTMATYALAQALLVTAVRRARPRLAGGPAPAGRPVDSLVDSAGSP